MDKIFKALADRNRRRILTLLNENEMSVNDMLKSFEIGQATLSNHLAVLRKADLVKSKVKGKIKDNSTDEVNLSMEFLQILLKLKFALSIFSEK